MSAFSDITLPSTDEEVWRYSRIAELDLDAYQPASADAPAPSEIPGPIEAALATVPVRGATVVVVNGRVAHVEVNVPGVDIGRPDDRQLVGSVMTEPTDAFAAMNGNFAADVITVRIAAGANVEAPIVVAHWSDERDVATFPRLVVQSAEDSSARVIDYHASADAVPMLTVPVAELAVGRAARLGYLNAQNLSLATWQIGSQVSSVDADAMFTSTAAAFGGDYARQRTDCRLVGRGATGRLRAVYFGEDEQMLDFRTFQDHAAPDTTSNLLFKGAVGGHSRSVYTGLIRVRKNAHGTNAFQTNRNIKLSDGAWAESVPNLEIENNDVRCSHASAVGPIDEDQRFYLESRGVPTPVAERLVVTGFFDEVLSRLPVPAAATALRNLVAGKLDRQVPVERQFA
ncbi:MAG TPA: SufD family Fe-S cluster assembly protein [Acidimicrobiales bacterium]|nr:SufD family Fe-S cluster assembly protein [Acidimicrobiales bacterium]